MFCNHPRLPLRDDLTDIQVNSFKSREMQPLDHVHNPARLDVSKLPSPEELRGIYKMDPMITHTDAIVLVNLSYPTRKVHTPSHTGPGSRARMRSDSSPDMEDSKKHPSRAVMKGGWGWVVKKWQLSQASMLPVTAA